MSATAATGAAPKSKFFKCVWENGMIRAHGVVASHPLRMWKALGSNPCVLRFTLLVLALMMRKVEVFPGPKTNEEIGLNSCNLLSSVLDYS